MSITIVTDWYKTPGASCEKCHDMPEIVCNFCYCPLYDKVCSGSYRTLPSGVKDCSDCTIPHTREFAAQNGVSA